MDVMLLGLAAIFILWPMLEIMILIKLGEFLGFWSAFILVVGTGFLGAWLARLEGARTWFNVQQALRSGQMPGEQVIDAFLILVSGILLITPGFLTDITGLLLLIPQTRFWFKKWLRKKFDAMLRQASETGSSAEIRFFNR
jgi:UPF0716 protein FxsA